jgi:hypothetical protein
MNIRIFLYLFLLFGFSFSKAQKLTTKEKGYSVMTEFQIMETTHGTIFRGGNFVAGRSVSPKLFLGAGAELSYCHYHNDNYWDLYNLYFLPIFIDARYNITQHSRVTPYLELSQGISFVNYKKESQLHLWNPYHVFETGYYMYGGGGVSIKISEHFKYIINCGFKAYHMSFNRLDVNPRGSTLRTGIMIMF